MWSAKWLMTNLVATPLAGDGCLTVVGDKPQCYIRHSKFSFSHQEINGFLSNLLAHPPVGFLRGDKAIVASQIARFRQEQFHQG